MFRDLARTLLHESTILARLDEIAARITDDYRGKDLTVIAVLNGSFMFMGDLLRRIPLPLRVDCVSVASYHGGTESSGRVTFDQISLPAVAGRHALILDDILDSGLTLEAVAAKLGGLGALSVKTCVLLRKRKTRTVNIDADYTAFDIGDEFVVGYGLDFQEKYRNLPCIAVLHPDVIRAGLEAPVGASPEEVPSPS